MNCEVGRCVFARLSSWWTCTLMLRARSVHLAVFCLVLLRHILGLSKRKYCQICSASEMLTRFQMYVLQTITCRAFMVTSSFDSWLYKQQMQGYGKVSKTKSWFHWLEVIKGLVLRVPASQTLTSDTRQGLWTCLPPQTAQVRSLQCV